MIISSRVILQCPITVGVLTWRVLENKTIHRDETHTPYKNNKKVWEIEALTLKVQTITRHGYNLMLAPVYSFT